MTNGPAQTPPPPPAGGTPTDATPPPAAKKKGLSPLAWVGIGCGVILLLGLLATALLVGWGVKKAGDVARDFEANPAMAAAKMAVQVNPEIELVEADDEAGTLTVRNKETGEVMTVGLDEIEEGRITFESDGETVSMGMEEGEDGEGAFTVRDREGNTTFRVGSGGEENVPDWVPRYEGAEPEGTMFHASGGEMNGGYSFETSDSVDDVLAYFREALEDAGMSQTGSTDTTGGGSRLANVTYEGDGRTVGVVATSDGGDTIHVVVSFSAPVEE